MGGKTRLHSKGAGSIGRHRPGVGRREKLALIRPQRPDLADWEVFHGKNLEINTSHLSVCFNIQDGSIISCVNRETDRQWADEQHPLGVFSYQSFSAADYQHFFQQYIIPELRNCDWPKEDFCKPGLELANPIHKIWPVKVQNCYIKKTSEFTKVIFTLVFEKKCCEEYGAPGEVYLAYEILQDSARIHADLQWFKKSACRLPEALWFSFIPLTDENCAWWIEKMGRKISPMSVVENGNRHLHAVGHSIQVQDNSGSLAIFPYDSPLVAPGQRSLLDFNNDLPKIEMGMHFCLLDNLWGTNFPMWFEEDCRFRFDITL